MIIPRDSTDIESNYKKVAIDNLRTKRLNYLVQYIIKALMYIVYSINLHNEIISVVLSSKYDITYTEFISFTFVNDPEILMQQ